MKRGGLLVLAMGLLFFCSISVLAQAQEGIQKHASCKYRGMNRHPFAHSYAVIEYDDPSPVGTLSIHCHFKGDLPSLH